MSDFNAIESLSQAGISVDGSSEDERAVYASLSEAEVAVLTGLKSKLAAANSDVEAHVEDSGGNFW